VELSGADGKVWYDILAFSRPQNMLVRLGYPLTRSLQRKSWKSSKLAMLQAVGGESLVGPC